MQAPRLQAIEIHFLTRLNLGFDGNERGFSDEESLRGFEGLRGEK